jgi:hypothetical protein
LTSIIIAAVEDGNMPRPANAAAAAAAAAVVAAAAAAAALMLLPICMTGLITRTFNPDVCCALLPIAATQG